MSDRRDFLKTFLASGAAVLLTSELASRRTLGGPLFPALWPDSSATDPWSQVPEILARIKPPAFPKRDFNLISFGAIGNGQADCTEPFRQAIATCNKAGGGRVLVPAGGKLTRPHHLP